jgi:hypothetical protein
LGTKRKTIRAERSARPLPNQKGPVLYLYEPTAPKLHWSADGRRTGAQGQDVSKYRREGAVGTYLAWILCFMWFPSVSYGKDDVSHEGCLITHCGNV